MQLRLQLMQLAAHAAIAYASQAIAYAAIRPWVFRNTTVRFLEYD